MGNDGPARAGQDDRSDRVERLRWRTLRSFEQRLRVPMALLGIAWLAIFVVEMIRGESRGLSVASTVIWVVFIGDFALRLLLAPRRWRWLRINWLTALSLVVPALRIGGLVVAARAARAVRVARAARAVRGLRLVRTVTSLNRGMRAIGTTMQRRGAAYVLALVVAVTLAGAAGMYAVEPRTSPGAGFESYSDALWWTSMIMTTMGSAYWPVTPEGRVLALLLSLFAIGVFGYVTATLAAFFIDRDATSSQSAVAGSRDLRALQREIAALRGEIVAARSKR